MHLLRTISILFIPACLVLSSCSSGKPLTPEEAFSQLREAYKSENPQTLSRLITKESLAKVHGIVNAINNMPPERKRAMAAKLQVKPSIFNSITVRDYLALQMAIGKKQGDDPVATAVSQQVTGIKRKNGEAIVKVQNGMELHFKKEGPYWLLVYE